MRYRTLTPLLVAAIAAALALSAAPARAERWTGSTICIDLDSVHIFTDTEADERLVSFAQRRCDGGDVQWWAVTSEACRRKQRHIEGSDLRKYEPDDKVWMPLMFGAGLEDGDPEIVNSGIACNWAYPSLFGN